MKGLPIACDGRSNLSSQIALARQPSRFGITFQWHIDVSRDHAAFFVFDIFGYRNQAGVSSISSYIKCIAEKSGKAVDRLGRPPFAFEDLFAFHV